jgi:hypothetical protein
MLLPMAGTAWADLSRKHISLGPGWKFLLGDDWRNALRLVQTTSVAIVLDGAFVHSQSVLPRGLWRRSIFPITTNFVKHSSGTSYAK